MFGAMIRAMVIDRDTAAFRRIIERVGLLRPGAPVDRRRSASTSATSTSSLRDDARRSRGRRSTPRRRAAHLRPHQPDHRRPPTCPSLRDHPAHQPRACTPSSATCRPPPTSAASPRSCGRGSTARRRPRWARPRPTGSPPPTALDADPESAEDAGSLLARCVETFLWSWPVPCAVSRSAACSGDDTSSDDTTPIISLVEDTTPELVDKCAADYVPSSTEPAVATTPAASGPRSPPNRACSLRRRAR